MGDRILAGYRVVGNFAPIQLYAGEKQPVTTQGVAAQGHTFGLLNEREETYKFPVVAEVGGKLVPWDPANSDSAAGLATGTVTFSVAVPTAGETVTINGDVFTFRAAGAADDPYEVEIGGSLAATAANLRDAINAHRNDFGIDGGVTATSAAGVVTVRSPGLAGNAVTLAEAGANIAVGAATLAGGTDDDAEAGGPALPVGIMPHAMDTTAAGYNADTDTPFFVEGVFNFDALHVPAGTTYQELRALFRRTGITIQRLY